MNGLRNGGDARWVIGWPWCKEKIPGARFPEVAVTSVLFIGTETLFLGFGVIFRT